MTNSTVSAVTTRRFHGKAVPANVFAIGFSIGAFTGCHALPAVLAEMAVTAGPVTPTANAFTATRTSVRGDGFAVFAGVYAFADSLSNGMIKLFFFFPLFFLFFASFLFFPDSSFLVFPTLFLSFHFSFLPFLVLPCALVDFVNDHSQNNKTDQPHEKLRVRIN